MEHRSIRLFTWPGLDIDRIETYPMADLVTGGVQNKGFLIEAESGDVMPFMNLINTGIANFSRCKVKMHWEKNSGSACRMFSLTGLIRDCLERVWVTGD
jgi:hypothetical protein